MDIANAIDRVADAIGKVLTYASADERRKRRQVQNTDRVRKAITLEEQHYQTLDNFIEFVKPLVNLDDKRDKKIYAQYIKEFAKNKKIFLKLT